MHVKANTPILYWRLDFTACVTSLDKNIVFLQVITLTRAVCIPLSTGSDLSSNASPNLWDTPYGPTCSPVRNTTLVFCTSSTDCWFLSQCTAGVVWQEEVLGVASMKYSAYSQCGSGSFSPSFRTVCSFPLCISCHLALCRSVTK